MNVSEVDLFGILVIYNDVVQYIMVIWNEILVDLVNCCVWLVERMVVGFFVLVVH